MRFTRRPWQLPGTWAAESYAAEDENETSGSGTEQRRLRENVAASWEFVETDEEEGMEGEGPEEREWHVPVSSGGCIKSGTGGVGQEQDMGQRSQSSLSRQVEYSGTGGLASPWPGVSVAGPRRRSRR